MNFVEKLAALAQKAPTLINSLHTEEATKNALVMPFIAALGYDVFNPLEVIPEFVADVGTKKGEKVDYAITQDGEIIILIECKKAGVDLCEANMSQLFRYFTTTCARIAILTNGIQYQFYSDLEEPNKMDARPFLELDLLDLRDIHVDEVKKLSKDGFDLEQMLTAANELKYTGEIRKVLHQQLEEPDEEFVRFFFNKTNPGSRFISSAREQFTEFVRKASAQYINERVNNRLRNALQQEVTPPTPAVAGDEVGNNEGIEDDSGLVTTVEELEGYHVVRAIVREVIAADRIIHRDTKSYMGILLDDNNRKPICRLRFNYSQKYLGIFNGSKEETKIAIAGIDEIYKYAAQLKQTALSYDSEAA
ncbi:MAG: type I restriction endonuclease [Caldilineaceae bacterium]